MHDTGNHTSKPQGGARKAIGLVESPNGARKANGLVESPNGARKAIGLVDVPLIVLSLIFAAIMVVGGVLASGVRFGQIGRAELAMAALSGIVWTLILYAVMMLIQTRLLRSKYVNGAPVKPPRRAFTKLVFQEHPWLGPALCLLVCWLPYLVICYPGTTDPFDNLDQLQQFNGIMSNTARSVQLIDPNIYLNNHHPVFHTVLLGGFVDFGGFLGSQTFGLFLFVLMQFLLIISALAFAIGTLRDFEAPVAARIVVLAILCFAPVFPSWAICAAKDGLFLAFSCFFIVYLVRFIRKPDLLKSSQQLALFFVVALLMCLLRNNGIFMVVFTGLFLLAAGKSSGLRRAGGVSAVVTACYVLFILVVLPTCGVSSGSAREALSLPIQQVAYTVNADSEDITDDQKQAIGTLFEYDQLAALYNPQNADPIKNSCNPAVTGADVGRFLGTWLQLGCTHPKDYAIAGLAATYAWYYPGTETSFVWLRTNCWGMSAEQGIDQDYRDNGFDFDQIDALKGARDGLYGWFKAYQLSPFRLATNIALCGWVLVFACMMLLRQGLRRECIPLIPCFALFLVCLASPINGLYRYALPYVALAPFLIAYAAACLRAAKSPNDEESLTKRTEQPESCDNASVNVLSED